MNEFNLKSVVYKARCDSRHILLGIAFTTFGFALGYFAYWTSNRFAVFQRQSGFVPAMLFIIIGLYLIIQAGFRFPRIEISLNDIALRGILTEERATWDSLGTFEIDKRPFGVYFGNDIVSAEKRGGGRFSVGLRPFEINAHALMMELNKWRAAATALEVVSPRQRRFNA
jgi:hypothetical protein